MSKTLLSMARPEAEAAGWKTAQLKASGAVGQDHWSVFEVRKNAGVLLAKYADGSYAYFFKRVR